MSKAEILIAFFGIGLTIIGIAALVLFSMQTSYTPVWWVMSMDDSEYDVLNGTIKEIRGYLDHPMQIGLNALVIITNTPFDPIIISVNCDFYREGDPVKVFLDRQQHWKLLSPVLGCHL